MGAATDELRRLLDERGAKWSASLDPDTIWTGSGGIRWHASQAMDGGVYCDTLIPITAAQAVGITLWHGTSKVKRHGSLADNPSMVCWSCSECGFGWHHSVYDKPFVYCPNCRRVLVYERD